ncbi:hypothetical protein Pst134EB_006100 [Puccinia striiformis f. sp. tritici]|nr:hypothetical protein Pst134EB_006100 [Puccinia striiformis f. sp. tritici]
MRHQIRGSVCSPLSAFGALAAPIFDSISLLFFLSFTLLPFFFLFFYFPSLFFLSLGKSSTPKLLLKTLGQVIGLGTHDSTPLVIIRQTSNIYQSHDPLKIPIPTYSNSFLRH